MSNQNGFNTGDIVKLKSGGPEMTVQKELAENHFRCQWFAGKKLESGPFPEGSLVLVTPEE